MEEHDSIEMLSEQDMGSVLGGAAGLGGWGKKDYSLNSSSAAIPSDLLVDDSQKAGKGTEGIAN